MRQDILSRKDSCCVLISTHHIDDVEVISDRVWFLNDQSLVFDGPLSDLKGTFQCTSDRASHMNVLDFSTSNDRIKDMFLERFQHTARVISDSAVMRDSFKEQGVNCTWSIALSEPNKTPNETFRLFLHELESQGLLDWSVSSPNAYDSLSRMYGQPVEDNEGWLEHNVSDRSDDEHDNLSPSCDNQEFTRNMCIDEMWTFTMFLRNCKLIVDLRVADMKQKKRHFLFSLIILPFCMILLLVFYCRDIRYPKMEFSSSSIGGIGEILVSNGRKSEASNSFMASELSLMQRFGHSLTWLGDDLKSNSLFENLYQEYYVHDDNRWSSFVIDDTVEKWISSSVRITDRSFEGSLDIHDTLSAIQAIQKSVCNSTFRPVNESNSAEHTMPVHHRRVEITAKAEEAFGRANHLRADSGDVTNITEFCEFMTQMDIDLVANMSSGKTSGDSSSRTMNTSELVLRVSQALEAKVTMLSNMTFFHGTPMFFKEVLPYIYASREETCFTDSDNTSSTTPIARERYSKDVYRLFSHPFDEKKSISPAFFQRGYLGSIVTIMYILLTSTSVLKFITRCKASGIKTQLHLSGVSPAVYWFGNFIVDFGLLFVSFIAIYTAISVGGPPISSFFLDSAYTNIFLLSLCAYAAASVTANYFFAFHSVDQVSCQLLSLFSSLCGGLFFRLFIALHAHVEPYVTLHSVCLWVSPSYAFSSNMCDLFVQYVRHFNPHESTSTTVLTDDVSLFAPLVTMCCQTVVYFLLTVVADAYYYRFNCWLHIVFEKIKEYILQCSGDGPLSRGNSISLRSTVLRYIAMCNAECKGEGLDDEEEGLLSSSLSNRTSYGSDQATHQFSTLARSGSFLSDRSCDDMDCKEGNRSPPTTSAPPANPIPIVSAKDLDIAYPAGYLSHSLPIIKQLNIQIDRAERIALMGVNGGGKSTLYRAMTDTEMLPLHGVLTLGGFDTVCDHWSLGAENVVGYVPQEGGLAEFMTVQGAIDLFISIRKNAMLLSPNTRWSNQSELVAREQSMRLKMYNILPKRYFPYYIFSLSGGNKQKLAVLLSNIFNPSLLLLDEPTSGIDPPASHELIRYLSVLPSAQAILFASHRMEECLVVCRRVLLLFGGRVQFDGPISEFSKVTDLFYQVDVEIYEQLKGGEQSNASSLLSTPPTTVHTMTNFIDAFLRKLQFALLTKGPATSSPLYFAFERIVRYSNTKVRFTFEKSKCPLSVVWSVLAEWKTEAWEPQVTMLSSMSLRKMSIEEIFAAMVDAAKKAAVDSFNK